MSYLDELVARIVTLQKTGKTLAQMAKQLNQEGFRPPKARSHFNAAMLSRILLKKGIHRPRSEAKPGSPHLQPDEWWLKDLAEHLHMPSRTMTYWCKSGWIHTRKVNIAGGRWIVWADASELDRLRHLRAQSQTRSKSTNAYPTDLTTPRPRPISHAD